MGTMLETLMKELIFLKLNIELTKPYGQCLKLIEENRLMNSYDILFLRRFKDEIRNPYTHADEAKILDGIMVPVYPIELPKGFTLEKLESQVQRVRSGEQKPKLVLVSEVPAIRAVVKQGYDKRHALDLFNEVYDFLIATHIKYFKQKEYDEHHQKFGTHRL